MNPYYQWVSEFERLLRKGKSLRSLTIFHPRQTLSPDAPKVLLFSPHPDDECITGALPLRLLHEAKWNVINVGVTLGSKRARRPARRRELQNACAALGFGLVVAGLEHISVESREGDRARWQAAVTVIAGLLAEHQPRVILLPHEYDWNCTHIGVHFLVMDALETLPAKFGCYVVETEFWGQMAEPNLLVESSVDVVAALVGALTCHIGEIRRNPYHVRLPAWMADNVRRGAEVIGGQGGAAPEFAFATIYRVRMWSRRRLVDVLKRGRFLSHRENAGKLFKPK
ncbi:MAG: PIG-L family deacetylase [Verrucomicrobiota bacterium]|jgi:LmbE family N-acetylglucosaminyl deacetylase